MKRNEANTPHTTSIVQGAARDTSKAQLQLATTDDMTVMSAMTFRSDWLCAPRPTGETFSKTRKDG